MVRRDDTYFDYDDNFLEICYDNSDENDSNSNSNEQINCFVSSDVILRWGLTCCYFNVFCEKVVCCF